MELWCVESNHAERIATALESRTPIGLAVPGNVATGRNGSIATVRLSGTLTKGDPFLSWLLGGTSYGAAQAAVEAAAADPGVQAILLGIDSPGGTVSGMHDLAEAVAKANRVKPVTAFIEDTGTSAAYAVASQAGRIVANNRTARVGSIGTLMALADTSKLAERIGVKPMIFTTGPYKAAGVPGAPFTEEHKAMLQGLVDGAQGEFNALLSRGRGVTLKRAEGWADGKVHLAADALRLGLIDGIESFEQTVAALRGTTTTNPTPRGKEDRKMTAATYHEIVSECVGSDKDPEFVTEQLAANATVDVARKAWMARLQTKASKPKSPAGADPLLERRRQPSSDAAYTGDALSDFNAEVRERMKGGMERKDAIRAVARANPDMHEAFLLATNSRAVHHLIRDRFDQERQ